MRGLSFFRFFLVRPSRLAQPSPRLLLLFHPHRWIAARNALHCGIWTGHLRSISYPTIIGRPTARLNLYSGLQMRFREGAAQRRTKYGPIERMEWAHYWVPRTLLTYCPDAACRVTTDEA